MKKCKFYPFFTPFTRLTQNVQMCIIYSVTHIAYAAVAQSVEQWTENPCVDSSILSGGIEGLTKNSGFGTALFNFRECGVCCSFFFTPFRRV